MSVQEYENDLRKELLIQIVFKLLPVKVNDNEAQIIPTIMRIADKINYKIIIITFLIETLLWHLTT